MAREGSWVDGALGLGILVVFALAVLVFVETLSFYNESKEKGGKALIDSFVKSTGDFASCLFVFGLAFIGLFLLVRLVKWMWNAEP